MPELPEVETIKRQLAQVLPGKVFKAVEIRLPKQVKGVSLKRFKRQLVGAKVVGLSRRAKMLIVKIASRQILVKRRFGQPPRTAQSPSSPTKSEMPPDAVLGGLSEPSQFELKYLVFHLKMTGQLIYQTKNEKRKTKKLLGGGHPIKGSLERLPNKYSHVIFNFRDGSRLFFNDLRQFGWVRLVTSDQLTKLVSELKLGPEPLSKDFKLRDFIECLLKKPKTKIYRALLDQRCVAGVGNIYANESLFYAGIRPTRIVKNVKISEFKRLYQEARKILRKAIAERGTSVDRYLDALGHIGNYVNYLKVYQRESKKCFRKSCGGAVKRLKINNRSAFYCAKCQI